MGVSNSRLPFFDDTNIVETDSIEKALIIIFIFILLHVIADKGHSFLFNLQAFEYIYIVGKS